MLRKVVVKIKQVLLNHTFNVSKCLRTGWGVVVNYPGLQWALVPCLALQLNLVTSQQNLYHCLLMQPGLSHLAPVAPSSWKTVSPPLPAVILLILFIL